MLLLRVDTGRAAALDRLFISLDVGGVRRCCILACVATIGCEGNDELSSAHSIWICKDPCSDPWTVSRPVCREINKQQSESGARLLGK